MQFPSGGTVMMWRNPVFLWSPVEKGATLVSQNLYFYLGVQDPHHEKIITVTTNGSIHSPKFPHTYPRNTVLVWRLVALDENVWIQLTFDERFGLEDPEDDICK
ncbi:hypothetical protein TURU_054035 [Turdus rufiventris]|nr:hypothetical protein TURU_054035 [Turdus rufiventris]